MKELQASTALIYKNADIPVTEHHRLAAGDIAVFSSKSPDKTGMNEDAAAVLSINAETIVLAVADGVGGLPAGAQASSYLMDSLRDACANPEPGIELRDVLLSAIEHANSHIMDTANGSATTLAAVEIRNNFMRSYHVGDSSILLVGQHGKTVMETVLHSPTGYAVESGFLSEDDAIHHEQRHIVSNVVGSREMHISMSMPVQLKRYDTLLLATDGLTDNIEKQSIIDTIRKGALTSCSNQLQKTAAERMLDPGERYKPDDITCILYRRNH